MKIAIHQPQYMAWVGYFHKMASADLFVLLDDVQFKKNEWQHRNRIRNKDGWQWLSVPNSYKFPQIIREVGVREETNWRENHQRSIETCCGRAPFFKKYAEAFAGYFSKPYQTIDTATIESVKLIAQCLHIKTPVSISSQIGFEGTSTERLVNICKYFKADTYLAGAGGHDYMDLSLFEKAGIAVEFQDFLAPRYMQHWTKNKEEFISGLSAIDLLVNCGEESLTVLMGNKTI
jgi:hypothetical protein